MADMTWTERLDRLLDTTRMDDEDEIRRAIDGAMKERRNAALEEAAKECDEWERHADAALEPGTALLRGLGKIIRSMKDEVAP